MDLIASEPPNQMLSQGQVSTFIASAAQFQESVQESCIKYYKIMVAWIRVTGAKAKGIKNVANTEMKFCLGWCGMFRTRMARHDAASEVEDLRAT